MIKRMLLVVTVLMLALSLAGAAWAGPTMDRILKNKVLKVGTNPAYPPLMMKDKKGKVFGYEADMARMLASSLKVKVKFVPLPFKDLIPALKTGMVDIVLNGLTMTADRNSKVLFVGPYLAGGQSVLTPPGDDGQVPGPSQLQPAGHHRCRGQGNHRRTGRQAGAAQGQICRGKGSAGSP